MDAVLREPLVCSGANISREQLRGLLAAADN